MMGTKKLKLNPSGSRRWTADLLVVRSNSSEATFWGSTLRQGANTNWASLHLGAQMGICFVVMSAVYGFTLLYAAKHSEV